MKNVTDTLLSQYANSPTITTLIHNFNACIDPSVNLDDFYQFVWNVDTAVGVGLDVWGKIVNVSRVIDIQSEIECFGFSEARHAPAAVNDPRPFNQGVFYDPSFTDSGSYVLSDEGYRRLILVKAMYNITDCTAPNVNQLLQYLFEGRGRCYVEELGGMAMRYVFEFRLTQVEYSIMVNSGAIPRPAGVKAFILEIPQ